MNENKAFLQIDDLTVEYVTKAETVHAVNNVSLKLEKGKVLGLVGECPGKVALASPVPSPSHPSACPSAMALRSPDNKAPLMVELTSQITARDGYGTTWRNRVCWCGRGRQGPFLTRWTHSGLSHPLPPPLPWIGGPAPSSDPVVVCEDKGAEREGK